MSKALLLFVHGLGGDASETWGEFPSFLRQSEAFSIEYDIASFSYQTGKIGRVPSLSEVAVELSQFLAHEYPERDRVEFLCHSQGGLIVRRYICNILARNGPLRTTKILTFGTPHLGSTLANLVKRVASAQVRDNSIDSDFIISLGEDWHRTDAHARVNLKYVSGSQDSVVSRTSSIAADWSDNHQIVPFKGHINLVKPESSESRVVKIAKDFFLASFDQCRRFTKPDFSQPSIAIRKVLNTDRNRFFFGAETIPFFFRNREFDLLSDFLEPNLGNFNWMIVTGPGGAGKSRLAHEVCKRISTDWYAGFLDSRDLQRDWRLWQPLMPTFIVIDYARRTAQQFGEDPMIRLLTDLSDRTAGQGVPLARPVKLLLLERSADSQWLNDIRGYGYNNADTQYLPNDDGVLHLGAFDDPVKVIEWVLNKNDANVPDHGVLSRKLSEFDSLQRPLFAHLLGEMVLNEPDAWQNLDMVEAVRRLIQRERQSFWWRVGATQSEERLLAMATIVRGIASQKSTDLEGLFLSNWDVDKHPKIFANMTGQVSTETVNALEPDIFGECFTIDRYSELGISQRSIFISYAWGNAPAETAEFLTRIFNDFDPANIPLDILAPPHSGPIDDNWLRTLFVAYKRTSFLDGLKDEVELHLMASVPRLKLHSLARLLQFIHSESSISNSTQDSLIIRLRDDVSYLVLQGLAEYSLGTIESSLVVVQSHAREALKAIYEELSKNDEAIVRNALRYNFQSLHSFLRHLKLSGQHELVENVLSELAHHKDEMVELAFREALDSAAVFVSFCALNGHRNMAISLCAAFGEDIERLRDHALGTPMDKLGFFMRTMDELEQSRLVEGLISEFQQDNRRLVEKVLSSPLDAVGSFLSTVSNLGFKGFVTEAVAQLETWNERIFERALTSSLDSISAFCEVALLHDGKRFVDELYEKMSENIGRVVQLSFIDALDSTSVFLSRVTEHGQASLPKTYVAELSRDFDRLVDHALISPAGKLSNFHSFLKQQEQQTLSVAIFEAMSEDPISYKSNLLKSSAAETLALLHHIPPERIDIVASLLSPHSAEEWSMSTRPHNRHWRGIANLGILFNRIGREDIADAVIDGLLDRKEIKDFGRPPYRISEWTRMMSLVQVGSDRAIKLEELFDTLGGASWILDGLRFTNQFTLAGALLPLGLDAKKSVVHQLTTNAQFAANVRAQVRNSFEHPGDDLSIALRLLGGAAVCSISLPKVFIKDAKIDDICLVPTSVLPHRVDSAIVESWQYALWLGLRAFASLSGKKICVEQGVVQRTRELWSTNLDESLEVSETPARDVNRSMIAWLDTCIDRGCLVPSKERVGRVAGNLN